MKNGLVSTFTRSHFSVENRVRSGYEIRLTLGFSMKVPFSRYFYFLIPEINSVLLIEKGKKERETEKELIGSLSYIKYPASITVKLSS